MDVIRGRHLQTNGIDEKSVEIGLYFWFEYFSMDLVPAGV